MIRPRSQVPVLLATVAALALAAMPGCLAGKASRQAPAAETEETQPDPTAELRDDPQEDGQREDIRGPDIRATANTEADTRVIWPSWAFDFLTNTDPGDPAAVIVSLEGEADALLGPDNAELAIRVWVVDYGPAGATSASPPDPSNEEYWRGLSGEPYWLVVLSRTRNENPQVDGGRFHGRVLTKGDGQWCTIGVQPYFGADLIGIAAGEYSGELVFEVKDSAGHCLPFRYRGEGAYQPDADGWSPPTKALRCSIAVQVERPGGTVPAAEEGPLPPDEWPTIRFADRTWRVKVAREMGPANNTWLAENVLVDPSGLVLRLDRQAGKSTCAEVVLDEALGCGEYRWKVRSSSGFLAMDPRSVFSCFLYATDLAELDAIEVSRWGDPSDSQPFQHVVQPAEEDSIHRFASDSSAFTVSLTYAPGKARFRVWDAATGELLSSWAYVGEKVPTPSQSLRARMNLWDCKKGTAELSEGTEVAITDFEFRPLPAPPLAITSPGEGESVGGFINVRGVGTPGTRVILDVLPAGDIWYRQDGEAVVGEDRSWVLGCVIGNAATPSRLRFTIRATASNGEVVNRHVYRR